MKKLLAISLAAAAFAALHAAEETRNKGGIMAETGALKADFGSGTVTFGGQSVKLTPPPVREVKAERHGKMPEYNPKASPWRSGLRLRKAVAWECSWPGALLPGSVKVFTDKGEMVKNKDFRVNETWGTVGRLPGGRIGADEPVRIAYRHCPSRIDSVILLNGELSLITGTEGIARPAIPKLPEGARLLANIYWTGKCEKFSDRNYFPVTETGFPAEFFRPGKALPVRTLAKLRAGQRVRIVAWGDSVTAGSYLPEKDRWQHQFLAALRRKYPKAQIELISEGWGGRTTSNFFAVPPGKPHNFAEKVLANKPDLVISEFINDVSLPDEKLRENYTRAWKEFAKIGAEWVILTPHYSSSRSMGFKMAKNCDDDPRRFVKFLRKFAEEKQIPLADASRFWGRLYRQGIPYDALFYNGINHPDAFGMSLFVEALMRIF